MTFYMTRDRNKNSYIYESIQPTGFCLFLTQYNIIPIFTVQRYGFDKIFSFFFPDNPKKIYLPYPTLTCQNPYKFMAYKTWM